MTHRMLLWALVLACAQDPKAPGPFEERRIAVLPEDVPLTGRGETVFVGPGGRRILWMKPKGVVVLDGTECKPIDAWMGLSTSGGVRVWSFVWSPDGRHVAWHATRGSKRMLVIDGVEGDPVDEILGNSVAFSADWTHAAYAAKEGAKSFVVLDGKKLGETYDEVDGGVSLTRDGREVAYRARRGKTWVVVVNGRELGAEYRDVRSPTLSTDGKRVAFVGRSEKGEHLVVDGVQGPLNDSVADLQFSPDARRIACRAKIGATWHVLVDGQTGDPFSDIDYQSLTFSADGKQLAYMADNRLILNGKPQATLESPMGGPIFSPDGTRVAYIGQSPQIGYVVVDQTHGPPFDAIVSGPVFSADDKKVGYAIRKGREILWKVETVIAELGPGDPAAVAAFEKIRAVFEKSAGYRVRRTSEGTGDPPVKYKETILAKGNRLKATSDRAGAGGTWLTSDGTTVRIAVGGSSQDGPSPADLREGYSVALAHGLPSSVWLYLGANKPRAYDVKEAGGALTYVVLLGEHGSVIRVRAWYDPKTFALVKRVLEFDAVLGLGTVTETYEECAVDPTIPDAEFNLKK